jgi:hypothetical protein
MPLNYKGVTLKDGLVKQCKDQNLDSSGNRLHLVQRLEADNIAKANNDKINNDNDGKDDSNNNSDSNDKEEEEDNDHNVPDSNSSKESNNSNKDSDNNSGNNSSEGEDEEDNNFEPDSDNNSGDNSNEGEDEEDNDFEPTNAARKSLNRKQNRAREFVPRKKRGLQQRLKYKPATLTTATLESPEAGRPCCSC